MRLPMHKRFQHFVNHSDVIVAFVLPLHIHQILVERIQAFGQQTGDMKTRRRGRLQELAGILNDRKATRLNRPDGCCVGASHQNGHLSKNRSRHRCLGDADVIPQDFHFAVYQH